jgi:hypothetical protein
MGEVHMGDITASPIFEVVLGLVVVWLLLSSITAGIVETIAAALGFRAKHLWQFLDMALGSETRPPPPNAAGAALRLAQAPVPAPAANGCPADSTMVRFREVLGLTDPKTTKRVRSIDPDAASTAIVAAQGAGDFADTQVGKLVENLPEDVRSNGAELRRWIESWFDGLGRTMQASYRRRIRWWAAGVALVVVLLSGVDSVNLGDRLYDDPVQRSLVVAEAERLTSTTTTAEGDEGGGATGITCEVAEQAPPATAGEDFGADLRSRLECVRQVGASLEGLRVSVWQAGWDSAWDDPERLVLGLLLTWGAVLFGAPFWFSVLKRMMTFRGARSGTADRA